MTINELRKKRAEAWDEARNFLDSKRNSSDMMSEEDAKIYDRMEAEVVNLGKEIDRLERAEKLSAELAKPTSQPIHTTPHNAEIAEKSGTASETYKNAFWNKMRNRNYVDIQNALQVGTDSEGGYLVPDEFEEKLVESLKEDSFMRKIATVIKTSSGERKIPVAVSDGTAYWQGEESEYTESDIGFDQIALSAYKVTSFLKISEELLNDSVFDLQAYILKNASRRIADKEEEAFLIGTGTAGSIGQPTGIFNAVGGAQNGVTTAKTALSTDDLLDLFYSLKSPYRKNAVWILNDTTIKAIRKLTDSNGNYLWQPALTASQPDTILGRPYYTSAYAPEISAGNKAIAFGDFSYYWIADRKGLSFKILNELYSRTDQIGFKASRRVDGKLILPEAVKTLTIKGTS